MLAQNTGPELHHNNTTIPQRSCNLSFSGNNASNGNVKQREETTALVQSHVTAGSCLQWGKVWCTVRRRSRKCTQSDSVCSLCIEALPSPTWLVLLPWACAPNFTVLSTKNHGFGTLFENGSPAVFGCHVQLLKLIQQWRRLGKQQRRLIVLLTTPTTEKKTAETLNEMLCPYIPMFCF